MDPEAAPYSLVPYVTTGSSVFVHVSPFEGSEPPGAISHPLGGNPFPRDDGVSFTPNSAGRPAPPSRWCPAAQRRSPASPPGVGPAEGQAPPQPSRCHFPVRRRARHLVLLATDSAKNDPGSLGGSHLLREARAAITELRSPRFPQTGKRLGAPYHHKGNSHRVRQRRHFRDRPVT